MSTPRVTLRNPMPFGQNGHRHGARVDMPSRAFEHHRDGRVRDDHTHARTCVRYGPVGSKRHRAHLTEGVFMAGTHYTATKQCTQCGVTKPFVEFENMAVRPEDRKKNGPNIRCRSCQVNQYQNGYLMDGFVEEDSTDSEEETWSSSSDDDEDDDELPEGEYHIDYLMDMRNVHGQTEYLVKWRDYDVTEATWEPLDALPAETVAMYHRRQ